MAPEELDTRIIHNGTLHPLRTYQQVLDFTQDKLAIAFAQLSKGSQTDFDDASLHKNVRYSCCQSRG
ncbi:hypothetical protein TNCV_433501 [Trichonephila clavipes]|nr:hypothetical protein TNCV_433501 [Trichonephila clavipes]